MNAKRLAELIARGACIYEVEDDTIQNVLNAVINALAEATSSVETNAGRVTHDEERYVCDVINELGAYTLWAPSVTNAGADESIHDEQARELLARHRK